MPRCRPRRITAVDMISRNRRADMRAMHAQLMRSPRLRFKLDPDKAISPPKHTPMRDTGIARWVDFHPPAALFVGAAGQRRVNRAAVRLKTAHNNRPVGFFDQAFAKKLPQAGQSALVSPKDQTPGGILVQPMRQCRVLRRTKAQSAEMRFKIITKPGAFVHGYSRRLVEDRKSTRLNSSHVSQSRMPSSA